MNHSRTRAKSKEKIIYEMINQHTLAKAIMLACELNLDKLLAHDSLSIDAFAALYNYHPDAAKRYLRLLDAHNIIVLKDNLVSKGELCDYLEHVRAPHLMGGYQLIDNIEYSLKNNSDAYMHTFGQSFFDHVMQDDAKSEHLRVWGEKSFDSWFSKAIFSLYDFGKFSNINEIGGDGYLLRDILIRQPDAVGGLLNPRRDITVVEKMFEDCQLKERASVHVSTKSCIYPGKLHVFIYFRVLLALSDEKIMTQLNLMYDEIPAGSKLVIIDFHIPDKGHADYHLSVVADINILSCLGGRLRVKEEWLTLLNNTKWSKSVIWHDANQNTSPTILPVFLIEAAKEL